MKDYVRERRLRRREMFVPLSHPPGHAQADFGEADAIIAGVKYRAHFFVMTLPHSDACFVAAYAMIGMNKVAARDAVYSVFAVIVEALTNGEEVRIVGFGTFGTRNRPARTGRNSQTGEVISIPASKSPSFKGERRSGMP